MLDKIGIKIEFTLVIGAIMTDMLRDNFREYNQTHPWITFKFDLNKLSELSWMRLGEAISKCDHIAGVPLDPTVATELHTIYMTKGVHATTQIEGNTLSENEVRERLAGRLELPDSQEYLGTEVDNIGEGCELVLHQLYRGEEFAVTRQRIEQFNQIVLKDLPLDEGVVSGAIRTHSVVVGNVYKAAPARDCEYLLDQLCDWLGRMCEVQPRLRRPMKILRAILAHLYLAWIHPFGDGNGRTARLVEFQLLVEAGLPTPACHLLSNYYNRTRQRYYKVLAETSRPPYPVERFVSYALDGLVEELREQLDKIRTFQRRVAWINYVHSRHRGRNSITASRQRELVLSLPVDEIVPVDELRHITPSLAELYAGKQQKTVTRDLNVLEQKSLIEWTDAGVRPRIEVMDAFLPLRQIERHPIERELAALSVPLGPEVAVQ